MTRTGCHAARIATHESIRVMPRVPVHDLQSAPEASSDALKEPKRGSARSSRSSERWRMRLPFSACKWPPSPTLPSSPPWTGPRGGHPPGSCHGQRLRVLPVRLHAGRAPRRFRRAADDQDPHGRGRLRRPARYAPAPRQGSHRAQGHVDDAAWQRTLDASGSETQLLEAFADGLRTVPTNYFNYFVRTELDRPLAPDLEHG